MTLQRRDRAFLFTSVMIQAIEQVDHPKTQTRRVVSAAGTPIAQVGDLGWIRETWATLAQYDSLPPSQIPLHDRPPSLVYGAWTGAARDIEWRGRWRSGRFMPKWAARIWIEVLGVRQEYLHDISEADCLAETGAVPVWPGPGPEPYRRNIRGVFASLWDVINGQRAPWDSNPLVWVVTFRRLSQEETDVHRFRAFADAKRRLARAA